MNENFTQINKEYRNWLDTLGYSYSIIYGFDKQIKHFFEWLEKQQTCTAESGINHINQLKQTHIKAYFKYLETRPNQRRKNGGLSVSHLNKLFISIDKLLEFLHQMGMEQAPTPTNYRIKLDEQVRINKIEPFTIEEIKELQANISSTYQHFTFKQRERKQAQLKLIFALFYACGLRRKEGMRLKITDINFDNKTIFIRQGKNYKDRIVPMSTGVYKALQDYIYNFRNLYKTQHKNLFLQSDCTLINSLKDLQKITQNKQIQPKNITFHILRHSIATHLLKNGVSIENIAQFLGHSSLESTQIYTHIINR